jgi:hypothetical protein
MRSNKWERRLSDDYNDELKGFACVVSVRIRISLGRTGLRKPADGPVKPLIEKQQ